MTNIALIEDDEVVRNYLAAFLQRQEDLNCRISAASLQDFFAQAENVAKLDVVLTDIGLPGKSGIEGIPEIKRRYPDVSVVILSVYIDSDRIFKALCAGAVGYLQKDTAMEEILECIQVISKGGAVMPPIIARRVVDYFAPKRSFSELLTAKEQQVIAAMVDGLSYKMIGVRLGIGIETVRQHIKNIYRKLQVNSKAEVIVKSLKGEL